MAWVKPTGVTSAVSWNSTNLAYDDNTGTYAYYDIAVPDAWSTWLAFSIDSIVCDKIRVWIEAGWTDPQQTEIEVYYSGGWNSIFTGTIALAGPAEKAIGSTEDVTGVRYKGRNDDIVNRRVYLAEIELFSYPYIEGSISGDGTLAGTMTSMRYMASSISGDGTLTADTMKLVNKIWPKFILEIHDSSGNLISILENAYDIRWVQELNKAHQLGFSMPIDDAKRADILLTNEIWLRDYRSAEVLRKFILSSTREQRK